jgi:hypothetical protein
MRATCPTHPILLDMITHHLLRYPVTLTRQHIITSSVFKSGPSSLVWHLAGYSVRKLSMENNLVSVGVLEVASVNSQQTYVSDIPVLEMTKWKFCCPDSSCEQLYWLQLELRVSERQ